MSIGDSAGAANVYANGYGWAGQGAGQPNRFGAPYDPNHPTGGGNFNPAMRIDTSTASSSGPPKPPFDMGRYTDMVTGGPGGGFGGGIDGGMGGAPPPPQHQVNIRDDTHGAVDGDLLKQLNKDAKQWLDSLPHELARHPALEHIGKTFFEIMAGQHGLQVRWD